MTLPTEKWPAVGGEMGLLIRDFDWSQTPLGSIPIWPASLTSAIHLILGAGSRMAIFWGGEFRLLYNDQYREILGKKHPRALGRPASEVFAEVWETVGAGFDDIMSGLGSQEYRAKYLPLNRDRATEDAWFDYTRSPIYLSDGTVGGVLVIAQEATARVQAEQELLRLNATLAEQVEQRTRELEESEFRYKVFFETVSEGFCVLQMIFDETGKAVNHRFLETNPAFERHTGFVNAQGKTALDFEPDLEPRWFELYGEVALTGERKRFVQTSDVMGMSFEVEAVRIGDPADRRVALLFRNISEQKAAVDALQESEERFREMANGLPLIVWMHDETGAQEMVNDTFLDYFGVSREEMHGGRWQVLMHPEDAEGYSTEFVRCVKERIPFHAEVRVRRADGEWRWIESWGQPRFTSAGDFRGMVGTSADVTDRKQAADKLKEADRRKDEYLAMLGHELRNPLAAVRTATDVIQRIIGDNPRLQKSVGVLERQSTHMTRLIDALLEVSRIARGKIELRSETLNLNETLTQVVDERVGRLQSLGLELKKNFASEPLWVSADPVRVTQILDNLISNAAKFSHSPGRISVFLGRDGGDAVIRVSDTGIGIRPEALDDIFSAFHQEAQNIARGEGGLGLGLALVKGLVELQGGSVRAQSEGLGQGAEIEVRLPLVEAPKLAGRTERSSHVSSRRILVVEDNPDLSETLAELLELYGHDVIIAENGKEALDKLRASDRDIVLCDIGLPDMDGYEVARTIRNDAALRGIPLVALTGYGQPEDRRRTAEAGFNEHLVKPVDFKKLGSVLESLHAAE